MNNRDYNLSTLNLNYFDGLIFKNATLFLALSRRYMRFCFLFALVLTVFPFSGFSKGTGAGRHSITVVTDDNYPPYVFRSDDGNLIGLLVDEWKLWEKKTGVKVVLTAMDWNRAQQYIQSGQADVIETIFKTTERAKIYDFIPPYANIDVPVFYHHSLSGIVDVNTLQGFTIGVKAGDACIGKLTAEGITTIKTYQNYEHVIEAAARGEIKVFCVDRDPALYLLGKKKLEGDFRMAFTLYSGQFHRAVLKGNTDLLKLVNDGFKAITPKEQEAINERWLGTRLVNPAFLKYIGWGVAAVLLLVVFIAINLIVLRYKIKQRTSELRKANEQVSRSEEKYKALVDNAHESIYVLQDLRVVFANIAACRTVGLNEHQLLGRMVFDFIPEEDYELSRQLYADLVEGKLRSSICERKLVTASGGVKDHLINSVRIDWDGKPASLNFAADITSIKLANEELATERKLLRTVIDHIPDAIYLKDKDGRKLLANKADIANIGLPEEKIIGYTDNEVFPPEIASRFKADDDRVLLNGETIEGRVEAIGQQNGRKRSLLTAKLPLFNSKGEVIGLVGIGRDITIQKEFEASLLKQNNDFQQLNEEYLSLNEELNRSLAEIQKMNNELREAKKRAEESDQLKTAFLSNISHEIRTPLNGIMGFADQITKDHLSISERKVFSTLIEESGHRLTAVINDIVDVSLLQTQQAKLSVQPVDLVEIVSNVITQFTELARQLGLSLTADIPVSDSILTKTDGKRLAQILAKLLDNALKFTPSGGIKVGIRRDNNNALLYVRDTGIGIAAEMHETIFTSFRQADSNSWRNYGGQGLGLSIVKGFVVLMGGRIWLTSRKGEGSTFWISIPPDQSEIPVPAPVVDVVAKRSPGDVITILAAEDEESNFIYLETILSKGPYRIIHALNGAEAIDFFKHNQDIRLVLMDIKMPVMDGFNAFIAIREMNPDVPVIALTAFAMADEAASIRAAGFDDYLTKPYRRSDLLTMIERFV